MELLYYYMLRLLILLFGFVCLLYSFLLKACGYSRSWLTSKYAPVYVAMVASFRYRDMMLFGSHVWQYYTWTLLLGSYPQCNDRWRSFDFYTGLPHIYSTPVVDLYSHCMDSWSVPQLLWWRNFEGNDVIWLHPKVQKKASSSCCFLKKFFIWPVITLQPRAHKNGRLE